MVGAVNHVTGVSDCSSADDVTPTDKMSLTMSATFPFLMVAASRSFRSLTAALILSRRRQSLSQPVISNNILHSKNFLARNQQSAAMTTSSADIPDSSNIREQKQAVRKEIRAKIKALSSESIITQSHMVWDRLFALPQYQNAKSIGLFLSMPQGEIRTERALSHALQSNKRVYVPQVGTNFEQAHMELIQVIVAEDDNNDDCDHATAETVFASWPRNKWGIPEPPPDMPKKAAAPGDIDLLVVPGLAFDRLGNRLGQGKGYYDRFIQRMSSSQRLPLVAVCLDCQLLDDGSTIPVQQYDQKMDAILSPNHLIQIMKDKV